MDAWRTAVEFPLVDDRAQALARGHPLIADGRCTRCGHSDCTAAVLAAEALAVRARCHARAPDPRASRGPG
jgi:hypothetical protein